MAVVFAKNARLIVVNHYSIQTCSSKHRVNRIGSQVLCLICNWIEIINPSTSNFKCPMPFSYLNVSYLFHSFTTCMSVNFEQLCRCALLFCILFFCFSLERFFFLFLFVMSRIMRSMFGQHLARKLISDKIHKHWTHMVVYNSFAI